MDQRTIYLYLKRKGLSAKAIHDKLVQVLGSDAVAYSTVTSYFRESRLRVQNEEQHSNTPPDVIDNSIIQILNQVPLEFVRQLAKSMCISSATMSRRLTDSLGLLSSIYIGLAMRLADAQ
jgi:hypothetical protein